MQPQQKAIISLRYNKIMEYEWGSSSKDCLIYQLTNEQHKRYAELWMGTHKNGPSILSNHQTLAQYLKSKNLKDLPFLFKILCIQKALSIQLHPNKQEAQRLYKEKPNIYADDNEKPEMFLTLTQFQCFFGIISNQQLNNLLSKQPYSLLQQKHSGSVKRIIGQLCSISQQKRMHMIDILLNKEQLMGNRKQILLRLHKQFPYDIGILVSCLLKYKKLEPGVCFAIDAGVPHAYLRGSCLQIMKSSDNVVRLGLTPKLKDIPTILEIMNDTPNLDGIRVQKQQCGYLWNGLRIDDIENVSEDEIVVAIKYSSIGIVVQKQLICSQLSIKADKGSVLFFLPGTYRLKGPFKLYMGSYEDK